MVATPNLSGFRHDVNGMRAIAVTIVLLFHFNVPGFAGGFLGVDVFFVLSGFLMTSIIVKGLERGGGLDQRGGAALFLWRFYVARARRIVPALLVMVGMLLAVGWWALAPVDYRMLGTHGVYALAFLSNVRFWREAGYFDAASHEKWLLHTWSLSVEWQFYLLLPLALLLIWRLWPARTGLLLAVGLGIALSLAASVWFTQRSPSAAFFLLPTRAWQMLAGGLVFLVAEKAPLRQGPARLLEIVGLGFIGLSVILFGANSRWPGANAVLPVVGSMLVLWAARQSAWTRYSAVQWLGLSSYSLYLWHWPVFVALVYLEIDGSALAIGVGLSLSLLLGGLSYHFIENTSRRWLSHGGLIKAPAMIAAGALLVAMPALVIHQQQGIAGRLSAVVNVAAAEASNINQRREECHHQRGVDFPWCTFGGDDIRAVVIGDSHAVSVITAVQAALGGDDTSRESPGVLYSSHTGCPTLFGVKRDVDGWTCAEFNEFVAAKVQTLAQSIPLIIVNYGGYGAASTTENDHWTTVYFDQPHARTTPAYRQEFHRSLVDSTCRLAESRRVYLLRPIPTMPKDVPRVMVRRMLLGYGDTDIRIARAAYHERFAPVWRAQDAAAEACNVKILDTTAYLCDDDYCYGSENGRPLYYDSHHLSEYGNRKLIPMFAQLVPDAHPFQEGHVRHIHRQRVP